MQARNASTSELGEINIILKQRRCEKTLGLHHYCKKNTWLLERVHPLKQHDRQGQLSLGTQMCEWPVRQCTLTAISLQASRGQGTHTQTSSTQLYGFEQPKKRVLT
jgi:hypothetical protein